MTRRANAPLKLLRRLRQQRQVLPATTTPSLQHADLQAFAHVGHGTDLVAASGVGSLMKLPGLESAKTAEALGSENAILKERLADLQRELVEVNREKTQFSDRLRAAEAAMANAVVPADGPDTVLAQPAAALTSPTADDKLLGGGKVPVSGRGMSDCAVPSASAGLYPQPPSASAGDDVNERVVYVGEAGSGADEVAELQGKLKAAEAELQAKQAEVSALQEHMELRINQTPQFKSLNQVGCFSACSKGMFVSMQAMQAMQREKRTDRASERESNKMSERTRKRALSGAVQVAPDLKADVPISSTSIPFFYQHHGILLPPR